MTNLETPKTGETPTKEIERKFLITTELPGGFLDHFEVSKIRQGYLPVRAFGNEDRIRYERTYEARDVYTRTKKQGSGMVRNEAERTITPEIFEKLWGGNRRWR